MGKVIKDSIIEKTEFQIKTLVIDPGHGGHDPGCLGSHSREKHIALAVSQQLARAVKLRFPDVRVILTRDEDVFIPLHERAAIANRNNADLFISIHCNFMPGSSATRGSETYVMGLHTAEHNLKVAKRENAAILLEDDYQKNYDYDPNSPEGHIMLSMFQNAHLEQSILFAERVEAHFKNQALLKSRGVKQAGFVVLKETAMPSVLVETGFLSNRDEEAFLLTPEGQQLVAASMLTAFEEYKAIVEGKAPFLVAAASYPQAEQQYDYEAVYPAGAADKPKESPGALNMENRGAGMGPGTTVQREPKAIPLKYEPPAATAPQRTQSEAGLAEEANIQFHVQLAAASKPVDTGDRKWRNTGYLIEVVREDNFYKYQARNFSTLQHAFEARILLQARGFPDAFIVAYKQGRRISLEQAKKELGIP